MSAAQKPAFDHAAAHRYFAIECNNLAWTLVEKKDRTPDETERMISAAHAAMEHWREVGTPINMARATTLVTTACVSAGLGDCAARSMHRMLACADAVDGEMGVFDTACVHSAAMCVFDLIGDVRECARHRSLAMDALARCDDDERSVLGVCYGLVGGFDSAG